MNRNIVISTVCTFWLIACFAAASEPGRAERIGTIKGIVLDQATRTAVPGVLAVLEPGDYKRVSDEAGCFVFNQLPVGTYRIRFEMTGMMPYTISDQIVRPKRITFCEAFLSMQPLTRSEVTVRGTYFPKSEDAPVAVTHFANEEIRRTSGVGGDVSRIALALPSVAKVSDTQNGLVVRGGNFMENTSYIDNIEVQNINHFAMMGTTMGAISLINLDFVSDVEFLAGGFSPIYGDRLSSVMNMRFRDGNRDELDGKVKLSMLGANIIAEGPFGPSASFLFSAQRSYLDLFTRQLGTDAVPRYEDYQGKITVDLGNSHRLSMLGIFGKDGINPQREQVVENGEQYYGFNSGEQLIGGVNWSAVWGGRGYTDTSLSMNRYRYRSKVYDVNDDEMVMDNNSREEAWTLRSVSNLIFGKGHSLQFGGEWKFTAHAYDYRLASILDDRGQMSHETIRNQRVDMNRWSGFFSFSLRLIKNLTLNLGGRYDHQDLRHSGVLSPRFSMEWALSSAFSICANAGYYHQTLPLALIIQNPENYRLRDPRTLQMGVGLKVELGQALMLTVEAYDKAYEYLPMDPADPQRLLLDTIMLDGNRLLQLSDPFFDQGKAFSRGLELVLQKKMKDRLYGMISASYSSTRYRDLSGIWRDRIVDNRWVTAVQGGYKPGSNWELAIRWIMAGGIPYTPLDLERSQQKNSAVIDLSQLNARRHEIYNSLNIRSEYRIHFAASNLAFILDVWNVLNRKNPFAVTWDKSEQAQKFLYQWGMMPILGIEWEF